MIRDWVNKWYIHIIDYYLTIFFKIDFYIDMERHPQYFAEVKNQVVY